jgi:protocatechuate 3,4-dioxygenase beta subunit
MLLSCGGGRKIFNPPPIPPDTENKTVAGTVTDSYGNPVPGLTLLLNGQKTDIKTGPNGEFLLDENYFGQGSSADYLLSLGLGGIVFAEESVRPSRAESADFGFGAPDGETGILSGSVFDYDTNEGLDGAIVIAFSYSGGLFFDEAEDGAYEMELPAGYWLLLGWLEGYNPGVSSVEVQGGGESVQDIYLSPVGAPKPPAGITVSGTVTDKSTGAPVADALVTMSVDTGYLGMPDTTSSRPTDPTEPPTEGGGDDGSGTIEPDEPSQTDSSYGMPYLPSYQETTTDASGHYEFAEGVVGYSAYFTVNADGYLPANEWSELPQSGDSFVKDMEIQPLVFTNVSGKCIDENGDPVPNAWVEFIFQGGMGGGWAMPMMDGDFLDGMVQEANDAAKDYADSEGGMPMPSAGAAPQNAGEGGGNDDFDNPAFMKYLQEQRSNRNSSQEMPPDYFTGYYSVQADENGEFSFENVAVGPYYVFADAYRHLPFDAQLEMLPDVENEVEVLLVNTPVGSVEGVVTDEDGEPIPDVLVNCVQPYRDPFTFTDVDGHYRIDNIPASQGEWDMWIIGAYAVGYSSEGVEVAILEDDVLTINFSLERYTPPNVETVYFTGTVLDGTTGEPVSNARLYVVSRDNQYWEDGVTDADGVFTMNLIPTEYAIDIDAGDQGYQNLYTWFWVDPGYPQMEFYLWPTDSRGFGGWGGIETPGNAPPPPEPDEGDNNGTEPGGEGGFPGPLPL